MRAYLMLHGYGHDQMGKNPNGAHGATTMADLDELLAKKAAELGVTVESFQSNELAAITEKINGAKQSGIFGILYNPASWLGTEEGETVAAALCACELPVCEVHLGNINKAGDLVKNVIAPAVTGLVIGFGEEVYPVGLQLLEHYVSASI